MAKVNFALEIIDDAQQYKTRINLCDNRLSIEGPAFPRDVRLATEIEMIIRDRVRGEGAANA